MNNISHVKPDIADEVQKKFQSINQHIHNTNTSVSNTSKSEDAVDSTVRMFVAEMSRPLFEKMAKDSVSSTDESHASSVFSQHLLAGELAKILAGAISQRIGEETGIKDYLKAASTNIPQNYNSYPIPQYYNIIA